MATGGKEMNMISQHMKRALSPIPKFMLLGFMLMNAIACSTCEARNPEMVTGLSVEVLNYSQDTIASVKLNGINLGASADEAKIGGVKGSGIMCCSGEISAIKQTAEVTIETVAFVNGKSGKVAYSTYTTQAEVELPFPDIMDKLMIHVLPGRKVVIEVVSGYSFPRQDLVDTQIKALGLKREYSFTGPVRTKPRYTDFYKPD
jgi:hypothetical protein